MNDKKINAKQKNISKHARYEEKRGVRPSIQCQRLPEDVTNIIKRVQCELGGTEITSETFQLSVRNLCNLTKTNVTEAIIHIIRNYPKSKGEDDN